MTFIDIPTELLESIIQLTIHNGSFEDVMLICKTAFQAGKGHIPQYNAWKRKWTDVTLAEPGNPEMVLDILHAVAKEPTIARFIKTLDLELAQDYFAEDVDERDQLPILKLLEGSNVLAKSDKVERDPHTIGEPMEWLMENMHTTPFTPTAGNPTLEHHKRVAIEIMVLCRTMALLTLLPNITILTLPARWNVYREHHERDVGHDCRIVMETLVRNARETSHGDPPLGKLKQLLPYYDVEYDPSPRGSFDVVAPFMALPSLDSVHATNLIAVSDGYTGLEYEWPYPDIKSNVTSLNLEACCVDPEGIAGLVKYCQNLTSLTYSHHVKWHGCGYDWSAGAFISNVGKYCGETLKELNVTTPDSINDIETGVVSLKEFKVLEILGLSLTVFWGPPSEDWKHHETGEYWSEKNIPALTEMLPDSIKSVRLNTGACHSYSGDGFELFKILFPKSVDGGSTWASKFPALENTTLMYHRNAHPQQRSEENLERFEEYVHGTGVVVSEAESTS